MIRRPPGSPRTDTLFPYTTLFRSTVETRPARRARQPRSPGGAARGEGRPRSRRPVQSGQADRLTARARKAAEKRIAPLRRRAQPNKARHSLFRTRLAGPRFGVRRQEEGRVGKEFVSTCRTRWWP